MTELGLEEKAKARPHTLWGAQGFILYLMGRILTRSCVWSSVPYSAVRGEMEQQERRGVTVEVGKGGCAGETLWG